jgi:hypothetical protein
MNTSGHDKLSPIATNDNRILANYSMRNGGPPISSTLGGINNNG